MDLETIFLEMTEEEKDNYFSRNTIDYYQYIKELPLFKEIEEKMNHQEKLNETEWDFILKRLFLVFIRSLEEEKRIGLAGKIFIVFSKLNIKILKQNSALYNTLYKVMQLVSSNEQEATINDNLYDGICAVNYSKTEENLENLLGQYQVANHFRKNKKAFYNEFQMTPLEKISSNEQLYIHAFNQAYEEEKKLVKKYFITN